MELQGTHIKLALPLESVYLFRKFSSDTVSRNKLLNELFIAYGNIGEFLRNETCRPMLCVNSAFASYK